MTRHGKSFRAKLLSSTIGTFDVLEDAAVAYANAYQKQFGSAASSAASSSPAAQVSVRWLRVLVPVVAPVRLEQSSRLAEGSLQLSRQRPGVSPRWASRPSRAREPVEPETTSSSSGVSSSSDDTSSSDDADTSQPDGADQSQSGQRLTAFLMPAASSSSMAVATAASRRSTRLQQVHGLDGELLPFVCGPSGVGPLSTANRGLYVADGATITAGTIYPVKISERVSFPRPDTGSDADLETWEQTYDNCLSALLAKGHYVIPLDANDLNRNEAIVFQSSELAAPRELRRWEVDQHVQIATLDPPTYAVMKTDESPFNLLNDAAYEENSTEQEYLSRLEYNHAEFVIGIGPDGSHDRLFIRFHRQASGGQEVFATYGFHYWRTVVSDTA